MQITDRISGEEVNYSSDAVARLSVASTTAADWGLSFTLDGFGNLTAQTVTKGSAPAMSMAVDPGRTGGWPYLRRLGVPDWIQSIMETETQKVLNDILATIEQRSGVALAGIQLARESSETARRTFPVLRDCMLAWPPSGVRGEVYITFGRYAGEFIEDMCAWYVREDDELNRGFLMQALSFAITRKNAVRLWQWYRNSVLGYTDSTEEAQYRFLCRLWSKSSNEAKDEVAAAVYDRLLRCSRPRAAIYSYVAKIRDERIHSWLMARLRSEQDPHALRALRRALGVDLRVHPAFSPRNRGPRLDGEVLFSTEVDVAELPGLQVGALRLPDEVRNPENFQALVIDRWYEVAFASGGKRLSAWLRLEDLDVVEVVIRAQAFDSSK